MTHIDWIPIADFHITPEMENQCVLIWVEQHKLCPRKIPQILTGDIIDGEIQICDEHNPDDLNWRLSDITHYAFYNSPYETLD